MKKLFGENIKPKCSYCEHYITESGNSICKKNKLLNNSYCRSFKYDPLMRVPKKTSFKKTYTMDDFGI